MREYICIGLLAHVDAGKTTLSEALLHRTGAIRSAGRVDHGDAFLDTDENHYGLAGSPTQVERIFPPDNDTEHEVWEGPDSGERLLNQLKKWKFV